MDVHAFFSISNFNPLFALLLRTKVETGIYFKNKINPIYELLGSIQAKIFRGIPMSNLIYIFSLGKYATSDAIPARILLE